MNAPGAWLLFGATAIVCFYMGSKGIRGQPIRVISGKNLTGIRAKVVGAVLIVIGIVLLVMVVALERMWPR